MEVDLNQETETEVQLKEGKDLAPTQRLLKWPLASGRCTLAMPLAPRRASQVLPGNTAGTWKSLDETPS